MNQAQAKEALEMGKKIRHLYFLAGEYIHKKEGTLQDGNGTILDESEFWERKYQYFWQNDWHEFERFKLPISAGYIGNIGGLGFAQAIGKVANDEESNENIDAESCNKFDIDAIDGQVALLHTLLSLMPNVITDNSRSDYDYEQSTLEVKKAMSNPSYKPFRNLHKEKVSKRKVRRNKHK